MFIRSRNYLFFFFFFIKNDIKNPLNNLVQKKIIQNDEIISLIL